MAETTLLDVNLLQELQKDNPWWKNNKIPEDWDKPFYRSDFYKYITQLDSKDIQVIIGPRRVGKTILLYQLMKYLMITQKIEGKNIIYLDLSKPYIAFNIGGILPCLKVYQENILKKDFADLKKETILNEFMPTSSFPSDHATVTMAIAMMSLFRGIKNKDKKFLRFGGILIVFSFITSFARVTSGVHWPTDIIA